MKVMLISPNARGGPTPIQPLFPPLSVMIVAALTPPDIEVEIVDESVIRSDPNRTLIPDFIVHAVVHEPWCAHPSYVQGYYDRDNEFYMQWDEITKDHESTMKYMEEWVYGVEDRAAYMRKIPEEKIRKLKFKPAMSTPVNFGTM